MRWDEYFRKRSKEKRLQKQPQIGIAGKTAINKYQEKNNYI